MVKLAYEEGTLLPSDNEMLLRNTPIEYYSELNLWVKREDLCCPPPGPPFSKTRGVWAHIKDRKESVIGVLDTVHSQAGHAVARACQLLGKRCVNYYPDFVKTKGEIRPAQQRAKELDAKLVPLPAGRSCVLYHQAKKDLPKHVMRDAKGTYMMPNALKLNESVTETAREVLYIGHRQEEPFDQVVIPASSGTIAAGVVRGFVRLNVLIDYPLPLFIIHLGYDRSENKTRNYIIGKAAHGQKEGDYQSVRMKIVQEGYKYKDVARSGDPVFWPCNEYYDLKAFRYVMREKRLREAHRTLFWNIG